MDAQKPVCNGLEEIADHLGFSISTINKLLRSDLRFANIVKKNVGIDKCFALKDDLDEWVRNQPSWAAHNVPQ